MVVTVLGMITAGSVGQPAKAETPMAVTGRSVMVSGMFTRAAEQVHAVIVIVPLLVIHVNSAPSIAGAITIKSMRTAIVDRSCLWTLSGLNFCGDVFVTDFIRSRYL